MTNDSCFAPSSYRASLSHQDCECVEGGEAYLTPSWHPCRCSQPHQSKGFIMEVRGVILCKTHLSWYSLTTYTIHHTPYTIHQKLHICTDLKSTLALAAADLRGSAPIDMKVLCEISILICLVVTVLVGPCQRSSALIWCYFLLVGMH